MDVWDLYGVKSKMFISMSTYAIRTLHGVGGYGYGSTCHSNCSYHSDGSDLWWTTEHPKHWTDCTPRGCIPGCNSKPASIATQTLPDFYRGRHQWKFVLIGSARSNHSHRLPDL